MDHDTKAAPNEVSERYARLREYYDNTDQSDNMEGGTWETDVDPDPMVTSSLRLPKSTLDRVRALAAAERMRPTALMRRWIEHHAADQHNSVASRLDRLEGRVFGEGQAEPIMSAHVLEQANRLAGFVQKLRDEPSPSVDPAELMDANTAAEMLAEALPTVKNDELREAFATMLGSWREFRDNRLNYHVE